jgi:kynureninase
MICESVSAEIPTKSAEGAHIPFSIRAIIERRSINHVNQWKMKMVSRYCGGDAPDFQCNSQLFQKLLPKGIGSRSHIAIGEARKLNLFQWNHSAHSLHERRQSVCHDSSTCLFQRAGDAVIATLCSPVGCVTSFEHRAREKSKC